MADIQLRKAKRDDLRKISELFKTEYAKPPYNEKWSNETALKKIQNYYKGNEIIVAVSEGKILGFIIFNEFLWDKGKEGFIDEIVVQAKEQGKGIGKKLMDYAEQYLKKRGIKKMGPMSVKKSKAFQIYKKRGYFVQEDFVSMKKKLK